MSGTHEDHLQKAGSALAYLANLVIIIRSDTEQVRQAEGNGTNHQVTGHIQLGITQVLHQPQPPQIVGKLTGKEPHFTANPFLNRPAFTRQPLRSEEHTSELQSRPHLVCRLLLEKKKKNTSHCPSPEP